MQLVQLGANPSLRCQKTTQGRPDRSTPRPNRSSKHDRLMICTVLILSTRLACDSNTRRPCRVDGGLLAPLLLYLTVLTVKNMALV
jgi:hypothetical protein